MAVSGVAYVMQGHTASILGRSRSADGEGERVNLSFELEQEKQVN